jgi:hypothetical protein
MKKTKTIDVIAMEHSIQVHNAVNHKYDDSLPYEYHLTSAVNNGWKFIYLIPEQDRLNVIGGIWEHDSIEDAMQTFNNVKDATNEMIAELAYACTNEKGKTRAERANHKYYEGIRNTKYATFVKLCDRIANIEHSLNSKHRMFDMYKKEHQHFKNELYSDEYKDMWDYLDNIFNHDEN